MRKGLYNTFVGATLLSTTFLVAANCAPILTDVEGTTKTLKAQGFEPVEVGGGKWFGGSKGDFWRTKFTANNIKGEKVEGYATKGLFKGTTLRFE